MLGLDPAQMIALAPVDIAVPGARATTVIPVPDVPSLLGQRLFVQALMFDGLGSLRLTNVVGDSIWR